MTENTIEQMEALKEGTAEGPWKVRRDKWGGGLDCPEIMGNEDNLRLAAAAPELVDALIAEKQAHAKLRAEVERERDEIIQYLHDEGVDSEDDLINTVEWASMQEYGEMKYQFYIAQTLTRILGANND